MPDEARLIAAFVLALGAAFAATPVAIARRRPHQLPRPAGRLQGPRAPDAVPGRRGRARRLPARRRHCSAASSRGSRRSSPAPARSGRSARSTTASGSPPGRAWRPSASRRSCSGHRSRLGRLAGRRGGPALTIVWVVGLVNAFNLIDNMDGAAATLAAVTSVAIGALALLEGDVPLAILVFGLAGACLGFLPYNLASPGAHLPRRRRQPADRVRGRGRAHGAAHGDELGVRASCSRRCCSPGCRCSTPRS